MKQNGGKKILIFSLILGVIGFNLYLQYGKQLFNFNQKKETKNAEKQKPKPKEKEEPKLQVLDLDSKARPFAVMIDNNISAVPNQTGLNDAYLVYEIVVEGGISRLFAFFRDVKTEVIGPVRSARHYYIDYALENDAYYIHFGHSPKALKDIGSLKVNNIDGLAAGDVFWRNKNFKAPHNAFTSMEKLTAGVQKRKYRTEVNEGSFFNYSIAALSLKEEENALLANEVNVEYCSSNQVRYEYDSLTKTYKRFTRGEPNLDNKTGKQYTFKNIIVYQVNNKLLPLAEGGGSNRQDLFNIGTGEGYYITNGYAVPITWEKKGRSLRTVYKYLNGEEIILNDGSTFINIQPVGKSLEIK